MINTTFSSSVASLLVWGQATQLYRQIIYSHTCNLYARASTSETYIVLGLKILVITQPLNAVPFYYLCYTPVTLEAE